MLAAVIFISISIYYLDKTYFLCPIGYRSDMVIRTDNHGDGFFAAKRNGNRMHNGIDLFAEVGTPVLACRSGMVIAATKNKGMGKYAILRHSGGVTTIYGHLSVLQVSKGSFIRQGQVVGLVGKTGNAGSRDIQPHLHLEVRKDSIPQDPLEYLE